MKYTAIILLLAVAFANARSKSVYPNACPTDWSIEQLLPHPNCHKFYQCWDGKLVEHTCPDNLVFSIEENRCEWYSLVDCTGREIPDRDSDDSGNDQGVSDNNGNNNTSEDSNNSVSDEDNSSNGDNENQGAGNCDPTEAVAICAAEGSDSVLVAHEKCNKFYICTHGVPVARPCSANLFFNPKTDRCDYPENVDCGDRLIPGGNDDGNNGDGNDNGGNNGNSDENNSNGDNGNDGSGNTGGNNNDPSEAAAICAAEDSDSILVAHEKCNKFYICAHGVPVARPCAGDLFFNPKTDQCDYPENVDCGDRLIPGGNDNNGDGNDNGGNNGNSDENNSNGDNGNDGNGNTGGNNNDPSEAAAICAAEDSDSILVAHEKCNKFYICAHGVPVARPCAGDLFFNPKTDQCDYPENVDCGDRLIPGGNDNNGDGNDNGGNNGNSNENNSNGDNGNDGNGNTGGNNDNPSEAAAICAAEDSDSILVAHEKCNKFYICAHGVPVARPCAGDLFFNPKTDQCDYPENVDCGDRLIPGGNDNNGDGNDNGGNNGNSNENNSNGDNGNSDENNSNGDNGNDGNGNTGGNNDNPSEAAAICAAEDSDSILVAHEKCNKFYICAHGVPVARPCAGDLFFNPKTDQCDYPENVDCGDRLIPGGNDNNGDGNDNGGNNGNSNENNSNGDNGNSDENNSNGDNGNDGDGNTGGNNDNPSEAAAICAAEDSDSILVAHEKCNKFYICAHGVPVARPCAGDLFFNPKTDQCDYPENVDCGDRLIPGGNDNNGDGNDNGGNNGNSNENNSNGDNGNSNENNSNGDNGNDGDGNTGGNNDNPSEAAAICAAEDSDSILVAHEKCNKFYICAHGVPVARPCAGDLFFNPKTDQCDYPENVDCGDRLIPGGNDNNGDGNDNGGNNGNSNENNSNGDNGNSDENNSNGDNGNDGNGNTGGNNDNPSEAAAICAAEDSDSILVAHEKCNKFYICAHGVPVARPCAGDLFFNPKTDQCDYPENVDCGDRLIPGGNDNNGDGNDNGGNNGNSNENNSNGDNGNSDENNSNGDNGNDGDGNTGGNNDNPSEAAAICAAEDSDSILVAHEKCNKFYICAHGVPVARPCAGDLFFNPKTDQCDYPENVDCGDRLIPGGNDNNGDGNDNGGNNGNSNENNSNGDNGNSDENNSNGDNGNDGNGNTGGNNNDPSEAAAICAAEDSDSILVAHEKCNKFYICAHGVPVARPCAGDLFFNPKTDQCDYPENVDCGDRLIPGGNDNNGDGNSNGDNGNSDENNSNGDNGNDGNGNTGGNNDNPSEAAAICAAEDSDSILVAHEKCNKFYICAHGVPVARPCAGDLFFNPKTDQCDYPENVDCGDRLIPGGNDNNGDGNDNGGNNGNSNENNSNGDNGNSDENNSNGDNGNDGNGNTGGNNDNPSEAAAICAAEDSDSILVAHEKCNKFYICAHGVPVARPCPGDLFFNPKTDQCDYPENVDCGDRLIPGGNDNGNNGNSNENNSNGDNGNDGNGNTGGNNDDPTEAAAICAGEDSDSILIAHEKCNKFYICAHGVPVARPCPGDLFFNPKTDQCDYPENVDCGDRLIPGGNDNGNNGNSNENNSNGDNGNDGNGNTGGNNDDPTEAAAICAGEDSDSILIAHEKCNKFYICAHGVPVARPCAGDLFFNPKTDQCDYPENVDCGDRLIPGGNDNGNNGNSNENNSNGDNGNSDENNSNDDNGNDGNGNTGGNNDDPSEAAAICAGEDSDSILIAHEKCNKFYICAHGVPVARTCAGDLFFNPKIDQCDYPENVDCGDRLIPGGNDNNGDGNDNGGNNENSNENNSNGDNGNSDENNSNGDNGNDGNGNTGGNNDNPSEAAAICAAEDSDSILIAHEKCNKFYICAHGVPVARPCAGDLFFNPKTDQCDYPENVDCGDRIIPGGDDNNGSNGDDDNDSSGSNGDDNNDSSGSNGDDNNDSNGSNGDDNSDSNDSNGDDNNDSNGSNGDDDNGSNGSNGDDNNDSGSDGNNGPGDYDICEGAIHGVYYPHRNCNQFFTCLNEIPAIITCPAGLLYDIEKHDCIENVDCGNRIVPWNRQSVSFNKHLIARRALRQN